MSLTERVIRDAKPGAKTAIIWDREVKGFGVRVTTAGVKAYVLSYREHGRKRLATLARCSELPLREARERAGRELANIRAGGSGPLERREDAASEPVVADLFARYFDREAPAKIALGLLKENTVRGYRYQVNKHVIPAIGSRRLSDVTRQDVERVVSGLPRYTRNAVLHHIHAAFELAEKWEWMPPHSNPAHKADKARLEPRDRTLSTDELASLASALAEAEHLSMVNINAIRFAALTGLRIESEVLAMRWEHVDTETGRLLLPETKTGRRWHDLPRPALDLLGRLPRHGAYIFSNTDGRTPATYNRVRKQFHKVARMAGLKDVRLHDLRRTYMTRAAAAGTPAHVLRDLLGHKTVRAADGYVRAIGNPVREARERVGADIADAMNGACKPK